MAENEVDIERAVDALEAKWDKMTFTFKRHYRGSVDRA